MELVDLKSTQSETQKRMQPQILIADDHSMIRKGLKLNIQLNLGYTDISEASRDRKSVV